MIQQDNDPKHRSKSTRMASAEGNTSSAMAQPESDLSSIKMLCHDLKKVTRTRIPKNSIHKKQLIDVSVATFLRVYSVRIYNWVCLCTTEIRVNPKGFRTCSCIRMQLSKIPWMRIYRQWMKRRNAE